MAIPPYALSHAINDSQVKKTKRGPFGQPIFGRKGVQHRKRRKLMQYPPMPPRLPAIPPAVPAPNAPAPSRPGPAQQGPNAPRSKRQAVYSRKRKQFLF